MLGGAILFDVLSLYDLDEVYISDINGELINLYCCIRDNVDEIIKILKEYQDEYIYADTDVREEIFYEKRNHYNELIKKGFSHNSIESAALFIFLNRTCFNGLYRVNKKGFFNVPCGKYKNPKICDEKNIRAVSHALQRVTIACGDYRQSLEFIDKNTFVYIDPPYRPLTLTSNFTSYAKNDFNDDSQKELAEYVHILRSKGAKVLLSNSDPKNVDPNDDFFDSLYADYRIERVEASRMINSRADKRGPVKELLISNYEDVAERVEGC
ncbi:MAG: Dam family site-specific DNA-(adenine-N6)-methyltransferase [Actinomycetaceae bacterium]|nr:Dam family site-specific DNA-(adenine-N6)-methyltransferase [Actinomycetaceae bacterium]